jgi:hypothetical protein
LDAFPKGAGRSHVSFRDVQAFPLHFNVHSRQQRGWEEEKSREKKPPVLLRNPSESFRLWFFSGIGLTMDKS